MELHGNIVKAVLAILACPLPCMAQTGPTGGWLIEVIGEPVSPRNPSITLRVSAYFPANLWALNTSGFDLLGTDPSAVFSNFLLPAPLGPLPPGPHGCFGTLVGGTVPGGVVQVGFLQSNIVGCFAHPANPLPIFEAQWTTTDFTPREVLLETLNTPAFHVFPTRTSTLNTVDLVAMQQFRHGSAVIQVIPAPGSAAMLLAGSGAVVLRRRRRMDA